MNLSLNLSSTRDFKSVGKISLNKNSKSFPIAILRDTGTAQSILYAPSLPEVENNCTGEKILVQELSAQPTLELAQVYFDSPLVKGDVKVALRSCPLPVEGINLLLGNDLAGNLVVLNLTVVDNYLRKSPTEEVEKERPYLFPACAVTMSQSKIEQLKENLEIDTLYSQLMSKEMLIEVQSKDLTLVHCRHPASDSKSVDKIPGFYFHEGVLMRWLHPPMSNISDSLAKTHQVAMPQSIHNEVIEIAHDGNSGHPGINNTYRKLLSNFYWPGMKRDVKKYVKFCHVC